MAITSWMIFNWAVVKVRDPIRFAGTCKAYSGSAISQQTASDPVLAADEVVVERRLDTEDMAQAGIAIDRLEVGLVGAQIIMDQPGLAAINGKHVGAAARIHDLRRPGGRCPHPCDKAGGADITRLGAADHGVAGQSRTNPVANHRRAAVAAASRPERRARSSWPPSRAGPRAR